MCGRFSQSMSRDDYLAFLADEQAISSIPHDPEPIGRYNVAPGTRVLLLSEREDELHLDPVHWGYAPSWWNKPALINARGETAATKPMFKHLWENGRAICFADGWFEWKREGDKKQPYFIHRKDGHPLFFACIGSAPYDRGDENEGFVIVTAAADQGLVDIHDRRPVVLTPDAAIEWMDPATSSAYAQELAKDGALPAERFAWHPVSTAVGNVRNQNAGLILPIA
ncbi:TPA: SOS response-associated peptidase family protein [Enterobacter asburiae]|nr:SOS response-associated peptidase family protein [Enterobacter asburiae]HDR2865079.1 SOS response-associated peptidase family protein [Enterobacter asburiae]